MIGFIFRVFTLRKEGSLLPSNAKFYRGQPIKNMVTTATTKLT